jgi:hypothetical protein
MPSHPRARKIPGPIAKGEAAREVDRFDTKVSGSHLNPFGLTSSGGQILLILVLGRIPNFGIRILTNLLP